MQLLMLPHSTPRPHSKGSSSTNASEHLDIALQDMSQARRKDMLHKLRADKARLDAIENKNFRPYQGSSLAKPAHTLASASVKVGTLGDGPPNARRGKSLKNGAKVNAGKRKKSQAKAAGRAADGNRNKAKKLPKGSGQKLFHQAIGFDGLPQDDYDEGDDDGPDFGPWSGAKSHTFPSPSPRLDQTAFPAVHSKQPGEYKNETMGGGFVSGMVGPWPICRAYSNTRLLTNLHAFSRSSGTFSTGDTYFCFHRAS